MSLGASRKGCVPETAVSTFLDSRLTTANVLRLLISSADYQYTLALRRRILHDGQAPDPVYCSTSR